MQGKMEQQFEFYSLLNFQLIRYMYKIFMSVYLKTFLNFSAELLEIYKLFYGMT